MALVETTALKKNYDMGKVVVHFNGINYHGSTDTEFSSMFDYRLSLGFKYTF